MAISVRHRGWRYDLGNARLSAYMDGVEAFRMVKSTASGDTDRVMTSVVQSSAATAGVVRSFVVQTTMTVASTSNQIEGFVSKVVSNVKTGEWVNAIFGQLDYSTDGLAHGVGSAICAEISLPGSSVVRGTYYAWQTEIDCPANCAMNGNPIAVMSISVWGNNKTQFDDVGLLFDIGGVSAGSEKFWDTSASAATGDNTLKIRVGGAFKYILVADDNN